MVGRRKTMKSRFLTTVAALCSCLLALPLTVVAASY